MEQIRTWLNNGGTYLAGVALLLQHTDDQDLHELFTEEGESDLKKQMLKDEMNRLLARVPSGCSCNDHPPSPVDKVVTTASPKRATRRWSAEGLRDNVEQDLYDQWQPLFLERAHLQSRIPEVARRGATDQLARNEACQMAHRILDLSDQIKGLYRRRDHYLATGQLPVDPDEKKYSLDLSSAWKEMKNASRYVTTMKNNLKKNPNDDSSSRLLSIHQATVDHYKKFFKIQ